MNQAIKKIIYITSMTVLLLLFIAVTIGGIIVWHVSYQWFSKIESDFLLHNRPYIRSGEIKSGNWGELHLKNVELGNPTQPLFNASDAVMALQKQSSNIFDAPTPNSLKLSNVPIIINTANNNKTIVINNIPLKDFIQQLSELPLSSNGDHPQIEINGFLQIGSGEPTSTIELLITCDQSSRQIMFNAFWQDLKKPDISGRWTALVDMNNNLLTADIRRNMDIALFQEFLLRSGINPRAVELMQHGNINGYCQLVSSYPELKIHDLQFKGNISNARFQWYQYKSTAVETFELELNKKGKNISWRIPRLLVRTPSTLLLRDISIKQVKNNYLEISARCDLRQTAVNFFCHKLALPEIQVNTTLDDISGSWNMQNHQWKLSGQTMTMDNQDNILFNDDKESFLHLVPEQFDFQASGTGNRGKFSQHLDFSDFKLQLPDLTCQIDRGSVYSTASIGESSSNAADTLEFSFNNFSTNTPSGKITLPGFAGQFNLRLFEKRQDIYLIARGRSGELALPEQNIKLSTWQCTVNAEPGVKENEWLLSGLHFDSTNANITLHNDDIQIKDLAIRGNGLLNGVQIHRGQLQLLASSVTSVQAKLQAPHFTFAYEKAPQDNAADNWTTTLACEDIQLTNPCWAVSSLSDCQLQFTGCDLQKLPRKLTLTAGQMQMHHGIWNEKFINSQWQLNQLAAQQWDCQVKFDALKLMAPDQKYGSGSFGDGNIAMQLNSDNGTEINGFSLLGEIRKPSWNCGDLSLSGDSMTCDTESKSAKAQSTCRIANASITGEYFNVMTPQLTIDTSVSDNGTIGGNIEFANGNICSPEETVELREVSFKLPFTVSTQPPEELASGSFTAGKVYYLGEDEGVFSGSMQHFTLLPGSMQQARHNALNINGKFMPRKFASAAMEVNASLPLPPERAGMSWSLKLPESTLTAPLDLTRYFSLPFNAILLRGKAAFEIALERRSGNFDRCEINAEIINTDWQINELIAEDVTAVFSCSGVNDSLVVAPHPISVGKLRWQSYLLEKNELTVAINPQWQLLISGWKGLFMDGKFNLSEPLLIQYPLSDENIKMTFDLQEISSNRFFNQLGVKYIDSDMLLSGRVNPYWDSKLNRIYFHKSQLANQSSAGVRLQITAPPSSIKVNDSDYRNFALAVLKNMNCTHSNFDFSSYPSEVRLKLTAEGAPAREVPFVYRGRNAAGSGSPFRPAEPGEKGFAGELELIVNFKLEPEEPVL